LPLAGEPSFSSVTAYTTRSFLTWSTGGALESFFEAASEAAGVGADEVELGEAADEVGSALETACAALLRADLSAAMAGVNESVWWWEEEERGEREGERPDHLPDEAPAAESGVNHLFLAVAAQSRT